MSDVALLIGGLLSAFAVGMALGRSLKAVRQFFDTI